MIHQRHDQKFNTMISGFMHYISVHPEVGDERSDVVAAWYHTRESQQDA